MTGVRKSFASKGDDNSLTRFVKLKVGELDDKGNVYTGRKYKPVSLRLPGFSNGKIEAGLSLFTAKGVHDPDDVENALVSGHSNVKIGRDVRKGKLFRGYWIYTLTLEERATCPRSCYHWQTCYGNNMPWAKRLNHRDYGKLAAKIEADIERLLAKRNHPGILIRLHALGDFFSGQYVNFWANMLAKHKRLAIYGYTAHLRGTSIGNAIVRVRKFYGPRFAIRSSNDPRELTWSTRTVVDPAEASRRGSAIPCPEQTGATQCCATCGLCWNTEKNIVFTQH